ncbi:DUF3617 family protein [Phenylobacterium sp. LjRoot225]|uniref:DUF3617 domain-containing protein n=1 Tax=Phenylobacterium sp. LjRoot225 TaxID=3342285 RepID=UPI003ECF736E
MSSASPAFALTLALAAAVGPAAAQPGAISPGYWETTNQVVSPMHSTKVERRCIRPKDVAKFMEGPSNHIYRCTYPTRVVGAGTIKLKGSCATRDGKPIPVSAEGAFTDDTFHMEARVAAQFGPMTIPVRAVTDAKRLGADCPAEPEPAAGGTK